MNRLSLELQRLYASPPEPGGGAPADVVRGLVLEVLLPAGWPELSRVWQGVQSGWKLPAPAIAVSGVDGMQLWFSLARAMPTSEAHAFLETLRQHFLADLAPARVRLLRAPQPHDHSRQGPLLPAGPVPSEHVATDRWSAFLAPDLAPVFADTPWLDVAPNEDGQAALLGSLRSITSEEFTQSLGTGQPGETAAGEPAASSADATSQHTKAARAPGTDANRTAPAADEEPAAFLRRVMNDDRVALALRIEAAKALLG